MSLFSSQHTKVLQEVIREIEVDPSEFGGAAVMPAVPMATTEVYVDVWEARGGMLKEHTLDADPRSSSRRQFRTQVFSPGAYKEFIRFGEADILRLRALGQNDQSKRGIQEHLNEAALILNNKIETRMEFLRWQAILNGTFTYDGKVVSFGKLSAHDVAPTVPWGANDGQGNFTTANASANPILDLRYWTQGGYAPFRKYKITKIKMNKNTARMFLNNPNVQSLIQNRFAAETYKQHDINAVLGFLIPGMAPVEIVESWWQQESVDPTTGLITLADAQFFIPDGRLYFETKLPGNDKIGDFAMTLSLAGGSMNDPKPGKFIFVDDKIEQNPGNPYIDVYGGVYGGPRLKRGPDTLTGTVI